MWNKMILLIVGILVFSSCLDLSSNLFNPTPTEEYLYDAFETSLRIDTSYNILPGELHEFSVKSTFEGVEETIFGAYLGDLNTMSTDTVILYCHGNALNMDVYHERVKMLYNVFGKSGIGVLNFDYRGFGKSSGSTTTESLKADTKAMIEWLMNQGVQEQNFFIYGFSLGSIPAVHACHTNQGMIPRKLFLEAPIGSIDAMAEDGSGLSLKGSFFADADVDNIRDIENVNQDLYWIHGLDDDFLSLQTHGRPIFENSPAVYKSPILVENGNHGDTPFILGVERYIETIEEFLIN